MPDLLPKLKRISVDPRSLYLDPNNPRFITKESDRVKEDKFLDSYVIKNTNRKMYDEKKDVYNIKQIVESIKANGWQPVDFIFVRKFGENRFVVLEGNRRVTAIHKILDDEDTADELREQLSKIEVMEVIDKIDGRRPEKSRKELDRKISYLLGVRHHGSLKQWSPFAQAASIYNRYLASAGQTDKTFEWNEGIAKSVAKKLSMKVKDAIERIRVYRVMKQLADFAPVRESESKEGDEKGGMKDRFYSLCKEVVMTKSDSLGKFIKVGPNFLLDESPLVEHGFDLSSLEMMVKLCHFDRERKSKDESPMNNPQQWRFLDKILGDDNQEKRRANLIRVVENEERPEAVWADREAELMQPEWGKWLNEVARIFGGLQFKDLVIDDESKKVMTAVATVLKNLEEV